MLYQFYETQRSLMEPFSDLAQLTAKLYANPLSPLGQTPFSQRGKAAASWHLLTQATQFSTSLKISAPQGGPPPT